MRFVKWKLKGRLLIIVNTMIFNFNAIIYELILLPLPWPSIWLLIHQNSIIYTPNQCNGEWKRIRMNPCL
jgi:hypothetical protein